MLLDHLADDIIEEVYGKFRKFFKALREEETRFAPDPPTFFEYLIFIVVRYFFDPVLTKNPEPIIEPSWGIPGKFIKGKPP